MAHHHDQPVPRRALIAAAALILFSIAAVALARQGLLGPAEVAQDTPVESRDLLFVDRPGGGITVLSAATGETVAVIGSGADGFLRGVMRGLARERRQHGFDAEQPFRLLRQSDGRLTLVDLATERRIELISFGPTNAKAFARFLPSWRQNS